MSGAARRVSDALARALEERRSRGLLRTLVLPTGIDLASNDYLGYASDPGIAARTAEAVRAEGTGAGAARLIRGDRPIFREAEARLARLSGRPAALLFSSGYLANLGVVSALAGPGDLVASDALVHASLIDGIRLSGAERAVFPHQDLRALDRALDRPRPGRAFVVTESVFSADGDETDLRALVDVAERHDAAVVVDEAHATGLYGPRGGGRVEEAGLTDRVLATVHTGGKAFGVAGAWVAAAAPVVEHLVNHARPFVFSTAPMPALAAGLVASLDRLAEDHEGPASVRRKSARLRSALSAKGIGVGASTSAIVPVVVRDAARSVRLRDRLAADGFHVGALRPPTVPEGTSRLRVAVRAPVSDADLDRFADLLERALREVP